jgi:hypothetical protein
VIRKGSAEKISVSKWLGKAMTNKILLTTSLGSELMKKV